MTTLEQRINAIEQRNKRVEMDKKWEGSLERKLSIIITTYIVMCLIMSVLQVEKAWLNAIVPTVGFFLSTLSLSFFKQIWLNKHSQP